MAANRKLTVFNNITLDGYFTDAHGDMSWAHKGQEDKEWNDFVAGNASGGGALLFGRITYEMMASFWPTPAAQQMDPVVAENMNRMSKFVVSSSLDNPTWQNTTLIHENLVDEIRKLKNSPGENITILGSGTIIAQLARAGLIDQYDLVINPITLGSGRTIFDGTHKKIDLKLKSTRAFKNGNVLMSYVPA